MRPEARPPEINVTPLVDVVLVLLIIFMVVIPQLESGAAIDVPSARHADQRSDAEHEAISLGVTVSGEVFLDREPIARAALVDELTRRHRRQPARPLRIKGDRAARYDLVRGIFRDCQAVGFPGVALEIGKVEEEAALADAGKGG